MFLSGCLMWLQGGDQEGHAGPALRRRSTRAAGRRNAAASQAGSSADDQDDDAAAAASRAQAARPGRCYKWLQVSQPLLVFAGWRQVSIGCPLCRLLCKGRSGAACDRVRLSHLLWCFRSSNVSQAGRDCFNAVSPACAIRLRQSISP